MEQFQKIPLGNHGNLCKLIRIHPHNLHNLLICLPLLPTEHVPVRKNQFHLRGFFDIPGRTVCVPPLPRPLIFGVPADGIDFRPIGKGILHVGFHLF